MERAFDFDTLEFLGILIPLAQYFVTFIFNVLIIVISSFGYKVKKGKGWLLLIVYGFIRLLLDIPTLFSVFAIRFFGFAGFGKFMYGFSIATFLFHIAASLLLVVGLFLLLKEYRSVIEVRS
ncbi:MAG: hypothetical protein E3J87_07625 [Candidatus Cloacimonadota bacterium]|nr:MAG: hypothetical protein E3J87_07625 [Candidatus Cloacimonadota bacterium]